MGAALIALSTAILAVALLRPYWLTPLNRGWLKRGLALNRIAGPRRGGFVFRAVRPAWLYLRGKGEDLLRLKMNSQGRTYWIERKPPSTAPDSMKKQF
ncbi:MAG: hypothetical protein ACR2KT_02755 [Methylocella sp.]